VITPSGAAGREQPSSRVMPPRRGVCHARRADAEPLQRAAAERTDISFLFPENANHVLKHEPRGREELVQAEAMLRYTRPTLHWTRRPSPPSSPGSQLAHRRWSPNKNPCI